MDENVYLIKIGQLTAKNIDFKNRIEKLEKVLDFYADEDNWWCDPHCRRECTGVACCSEGGVLARLALKKGD